MTIAALLACEGPHDGGLDDAPGNVAVSGHAMAPGVGASLMVTNDARTVRPR